MVMLGLLDTNVVLYLLGGRLAEPLPVGQFALSVISEMELLAWPSLDAAAEECPKLPRQHDDPGADPRDSPGGGQVAPPGEHEAARRDHLRYRDSPSADVRLRNVPGVTCKAARVLTT